jgi:hypothetical protein
MSFSKSTWGINIAQRRTPEENLIQEFTLNDDKFLESTYPRFQVLDTGYKEVSSPALKKRFREVQLFLQPKGAEEIEALAPDNFLNTLLQENDTLEINSVPDVAKSPDLVAPYMHMFAKPVPPTTGNSVALKALLDVYVDGNKILSSAKPEVREEHQKDNIYQIKIFDTFSFIEDPFISDTELSNTFELDRDAFAGVKLVRFRRNINGKGNLVRMKFTNITEANYDLVGHAFVAHNKNAR